jgi:hypothetical protein
MTFARGLLCLGCHSIKVNTRVWLSLYLHGRMSKTMVTRPARRGPRCQLAGRRSFPLTLWCTALVAGAPRTCGCPSLMRGRRRQGISVLLHGTPQEAAAQMRRAFPGARKWRETAQVGTTTAAAIREAGFDVVPDPTTRFPNYTFHPAPPFRGLLHCAHHLNARQDSMPCVFSPFPRGATWPP